MRIISFKQNAMQIKTFISSKQNAIYPKMTMASSCKQTMTAGCRDGYIFEKVAGPNGTTLSNAKTLMLVTIQKQTYYRKLLFPLTVTLIANGITLNNAKTLMVVNDSKSFSIRVVAKLQR
jgi:hypothetical protein